MCVATTAHAILQLAHTYACIEREDSTVDLGHSHCRTGRHAVVARDNIHTPPSRRPDEKHPHPDRRGSFRAAVRCGRTVRGAAGRAARVALADRRAAPAWPAPAVGDGRGGGGRAQTSAGSCNVRIAASPAHMCPGELGETARRPHGSISAVRAPCVSCGTGPRAPDAVCWTAPAGYIGEENVEGGLVARPREIRILE